MLAIALVFRNSGVKASPKHEEENSQSLYVLHIYRPRDGDISRSFITVRRISEAVLSCVAERETFLRCKRRSFRETLKGAPLFLDFARRQAADHGTSLHFELEDLSRLFPQVPLTMLISDCGALLRKGPLKARQDFDAALHGSPARRRGSEHNECPLHVAEVWAMWPSERTWRTKTNFRCRRIPPRLAFCVSASSCF